MCVRAMGQRPGGWVWERRWWETARSIDGGGVQHEWLVGAAAVIGGGGAPGSYDRLAHCVGFAMQRGGCPSFSRLQASRNSSPVPTFSTFQLRTQHKETIHSSRGAHACVGDEAA